MDSFSGRKRLDALPSEQKPLRNAERHVILSHCRSDPSSAAGGIVDRNRIRRLVRVRHLGNRPLSWIYCYLVVRAITNNKPQAAPNQSATDGCGRTAYHSWRLRYTSWTHDACGEHGSTRDAPGRRARAKLAASGPDLALSHSLVTQTSFGTPSLDCGEPGRYNVVSTGARWSCSHRISTNEDLHGRSACGVFADGTSTVRPT